MRRWGNEIKYWGQIFLMPIYGLSFLLPRNKKIWVFGSTFGRRFADNPKFLYLYMQQNVQTKVRTIWITREEKVFSELRDNGYEVYMQKSLKGIWYAFRASVYIFDNYSKDISFLCSGGAKKVNLWHGIPLKKIQMDNKFDFVRHPSNKWMKLRWFLRRISDERPSHYVLTTSNQLVPIFSSAFATEHVLVCKYPRNDNLIQPCIKTVYSQEEERLIKWIALKKERTILYMPTFRESEYLFFETIQINQMKRFLQEEKIRLVIKLHPKSKLRKQFEQLNDDYVYNIGADSDPYTFLGIVDALITDYSSIYFDFLLTNKPIIFFDYDREEYLHKSREMYFDYDSYTPGRKAKNMEELFQAIRDIDKDEVRWKRERERIKKEVFQDPDELGSEKLYQLIKDIIHLH